MLPLIVALVSMSKANSVLGLRTFSGVKMDVEWMGAVPKSVLPS